MSEFTTTEIDEIVQAISQEPPQKEGSGKIPILPPGSYGEISKVAFTPIEGEKPRPLSELTEKELAKFENLQANIEVIFGQTKLALKELAALKEGSLLPLEELCDDLVDIMVNGIKVGRGEIVAVDGKFGVKIISFAKNPS